MHWTGASCHLEICDILLQMPEVGTVCIWTSYTCRILTVLLSEFPAYLDYKSNLDLEECFFHLIRARRHHSIFHASSLNMTVASMFLH